jgi:hypothetical protein
MRLNAATNRLKKPNMAGMVLSGWKRVYPIISLKITTGTATIACAITPPHAITQWS